MPVNFDDIVKLARSCRGTPWRHQGRLPGRGLDCAGLIVYVANTLGLADYENTSYAHFPNQAEVQFEMESQMNRIALDEAHAGDVALVADDNNQSVHMGIIGEDLDGALTLIHAAAQNRRVVEQHLDGELRARWRGAFRFRGVQ